MSNLKVFPSLPGMSRGAAALCLAACLLPAGPHANADDFQPRNTQKAGDEPPAPQEALELMTLPEGFQATLFAAEPDVRQPIAMTFDGRGRLWVAESYSYGSWNKEGNDRILIFEDEDNDGRFDSRKIFWDQGDHISSIEVGFGGVWVCNTPELVFIPDRDGDDKPDGAPEVLLDGWTLTAKHNMFNGLKWGLDGWLYGRHGITGSSLVGKPGTPKKDRVLVDPGVWRLHPVTRKFELVLFGMTNPWGMDWDRYGEMFLSGNVNGHLWHAVPGAYYVRMFGAGQFPHVYERMTMTGERPHYAGETENWKRDWNKGEIGRNSANDFGGGHSHCGAMIYQGDNWPARYRGMMFMNNTHGRRINQDSLTRKGSGYIGKYVGDFMVANTPWFKGVNLIYGPDGGVYVSDWCDYGECHDSDGVHRTSGRIYKITYGKPVPRERTDLARLSDEELVKLHFHKNEYFVRHARRLLMERGPSPEAVQRLTGIFMGRAAPVTRLKALWTLHACGKLIPPVIRAAIADSDEHVRSWGYRLLFEVQPPKQETIAWLRLQAAREPSLLVRLHLASSARRLPPSDRWPLIESMLRWRDGQGDKNLALMVWYAVEPLFEEDPLRFVGNIPHAVNPRHRRFMARRVAAQGVGRPALERLLQELPGLSPVLAEPVFAGLVEGFAGKSNLAEPENWKPVATSPLASSTPAIGRAVLKLASVFGDSEVIGLLLARVKNRALSAQERRNALQLVIEAAVPKLDQLLLASLDDEVLQDTALRGLVGVRAEGVAAKVLSALHGYDAPSRSAAIDLLVTRKEYASDLLEALEDGEIAASAITPSHAMQIRGFRDRGMIATLEKHWGKVRFTSEEKKQKIESLTNMLADAPAREPDLAKGEKIYAASCAACHQLFGKGGNLGPDLTGTDRGNPGYLLPNIVDPGALVPQDYRMTVVTMKDGTTYAGVVPQKDRDTVVIQTMTEKHVLQRKEVDKLLTLPSSFMPEGILEGMTEEEIRDLFAYLAQGTKE